MLVNPPISRIATALLKVEAFGGVQNIVDHRFRKPELLWQALHVHRTKQFPHGNERLAQIGDAVLKMVITKRGFDRGLSPGKNQALITCFDHSRFAEHVLADTSRKLDSIISNKNLARLALRTHLMYFAYLDPNTECNRATPWESMMHRKPKVWRLATLVEAMLGAVYEDGGSVPARRTIYKLGLWPD